MNRFIRSCGVSLVLGGLLLVLVNVVFTPLLPVDQGDAATRTSTIYLVRLTLAGVAALLLLYGSAGIYLAEQKSAGLFHALAFGIAWVGTCLIVAVEWSNVFVLRPLAQANPAALEAVGDSTLVIVGFALSAGLFALGWLLLAVSTLRSSQFPRWTAIAIIAGLIAIPVLSASPLGLMGAIIGNALFGLGIAGQGVALRRYSAA